MSRKQYVLIDRNSFGGYKGERRDPMTGVTHAFDYLIGIAVFGFVYFIFNDPMQIFHSWGVSLNIPNVEFVNYLWAGCLVIYLFFGLFYFLNILKEGVK